MNGHADHQALAKLPVLAGAMPSFLKGGDGAAFEGGGTAADGAFDVVLHHEVEPARRGADHRLPTLHRKVDWPRHEGKILQRIAAVRHFRRQRVVLAAMREALVVKGL